MAKHPQDAARIAVKWVRDRAKSSYDKKPNCEICDTTENLEFHHYYSLTPLFERWCKMNRIAIKTDEDVVEIRDRFIAENYAEVYKLAVTLCKEHHTRLHKVYGKAPDLGTAKKQMNWVQIQKEKHLELTKLAP